MGSSGRNTSLWDSCLLTLCFIPASALQCTAALPLPGEFPHSFPWVDEGKAAQDQLRSTERQWVVKGGLGNDSFCWKSCLSLIKLKAAISTGFPVQHIVGMASRRSLPKEFSWLFQRSITLAISSFLVLFQLLKKNPLESTCGKKKHKGQKETKNNNEQQKRDIKGKINK